MAVRQLGQLRRRRQLRRWRRRLRTFDRLGNSYLKGPEHERRASTDAVYSTAGRSTGWLVHWRVLAISQIILSSSSRNPYPSRTPWSAHQLAALLPGPHHNNHGSQISHPSLAKVSTSKTCRWSFHIITHRTVQFFLRTRPTVLCSRQVPIKRETFYRRLFFTYCVYLMCDTVARHHAGSHPPDHIDRSWIWKTT